MLKAPKSLPSTTPTPPPKKGETLTELRTFVQKDFQTEEEACMAFHKKWPM